MKPEQQKSKQIIITADDFGLSPGVNAAVEKGWRDGILTCASIMAGGAAFAHASQLRPPSVLAGGLGAGSRDHCPGGLSDSAQSAGIVICVFFS